MQSNRPYPLDPLNKDEIQKACDILKIKKDLNQKRFESKLSFCMCKVRKT